MDAEQELASWLEEERRADERMASGAGFGIPDPMALARLAGIDVLQSALQGRIPGAPMEETLNFRFISAEPGRVLFQGRPQRRHRNPAGTIHGGWFASILDSCMTAAVYSMLPAGRAYTTLELHLSFVKALAAESNCVRAEGRVLHFGRQVASAEGRLVGPGDALYAHAKTTCLLFDISR
jgi:uncharacterized protein (TIGR00369 family)